MLDCSLNKRNKVLTISQEDKKLIISNFKVNPYEVVDSILLRDDEKVYIKYDYKFIDEKGIILCDKQNEFTSYTVSCLLNLINEILDDSRKLGVGIPIGDGYKIVNGDAFSLTELNSGNYIVSFFDVINEHMGSKIVFTEVTKDDLNSLREAFSKILEISRFEYNASMERTLKSLDKKNFVKENFLYIKNVNESSHHIFKEGDVVSFNTIKSGKISPSSSVIIKKINDDTILVENIYDFDDEDADMLTEVKIKNILNMEIVYYYLFEDNHQEKYLHFNEKEIAKHFVKNYLDKSPFLKAKASNKNSDFVKKNFRDIIDAIYDLKSSKHPFNEKTEEFDIEPILNEISKYIANSYK